MFSLRFTNLTGSPSEIRLWSAYDTSIWLANKPIFTPSKQSRNISDVYMYDGGMYDKDWYRGAAKIRLTYHTNNYITYGKTILQKFVTNVLKSFGCRLYIYEITPANKAGNAFMTEQDYYYEVLNAEIVGIDEKAGNYGRITVDYTVYPTIFNGQSTLTTITNNTMVSFDGDIAKPIYYITKSSPSTTGSIQIQGKSAVTIGAIDGSIVLDSRKMTATKGSTNVTQYITGDYENLWFESGAVFLISNITLQADLRSGTYI